MPNVIDLNIYRGTEFNMRLALTDASGQPFDLTDLSASGLIKFRFSDELALGDLNATPVSGFLTSGYLDLSMTPAETAALPSTQLLYDVKLFNSGAYVENFVGGYVNVYPQVSI